MYTAVLPQVKVSDKVRKVVQLYLDDKTKANRLFFYGWLKSLKGNYVICKCNQNRKNKNVLSKYVAIRMFIKLIVSIHIILRPQTVTSSKINNSHTVCMLRKHDD